jgi:hypothetical protein
MGTPQGGLAEVNDVAFTIGAEGSNIIPVTASLRHGVSAPGGAFAVWYYLSTDAAGQTLAADPGTTAILTNGTILVEPVDDLVGLAVTEVGGSLDFNITHTGTSGFYLQIVLPSGRVVASPIIQFA